MDSYRFALFGEWRHSSFQPADSHSHSHSHTPKRHTHTYTHSNTHRNYPNNDPIVGKKNAIRLNRAQHYHLIIIRQMMVWLGIVCLN